MADDIARRREIRKRKILESSEARLKKITSCNLKKSSENEFVSHEDYGNDLTVTTKNEIYESKNSSELHGRRSSDYQNDDFSFGDYDIAAAKKHSNEDNLSKCRNRLSANDSQRSCSTNGDFTRSCSPDYYTFPKKVSDAETRSFGRTRSDVRRNSSCTQIMMETLQFSSFSLTLMRFWLAALVVKAYFLMSTSVPVFKTIFIPFVMLEIALSLWSKYETQVCSRPMMSSFISGVLLLCGLPSTLVTSFNAVWNTFQSFLVDFCVYIFSFVFFHFIFEMCL